MHISKLSNAHPWCMWILIMHESSKDLIFHGNNKQHFCKTCTGSDRSVTSENYSSRDTVTLSIFNTHTQVDEVSMSFPNHGQYVACTVGKRWIPSFACFVTISRHVNFTSKTPVANGCIIFLPSLQDSGLFVNCPHEWQEESKLCEI